MELFRVAMKSVNKWDTKTRTLYVIQPNKIAALDYVNGTKKENFVISNIFCLGHELSHCMFKGGKEAHK